MADDRSRMLGDIADTADALTDSFTHVQAYEVWDHNRHKKLRYHRTRQPGLLRQVKGMVEVLSQGDDGGRSAPEGSPAPLNMEAASLLLVVNLAVLRWCNRYDVKQRDSTEDDIRALVGAAATMNSDEQRFLLDDLRSWHRRCSIITGWKSPPYRPKAPCPECLRVNVLVVNLEARTAFCANEECGSGWREEPDPENGWGSIYTLGEHVRASTEGKEAA